MCLHQPHNRSRCAKSSAAVIMIIIFIPHSYSLKKKHFSNTIFHHLHGFEKLLSCWIVHRFTIFWNNLEWNMYVPYTMYRFFFFFFKHASIDGILLSREAIDGLRSILWFSLNFTDIGMYVITQWTSCSGGALQRAQCVLTWQCIRYVPIWLSLARKELFLSTGAAARNLW